MNLFKLESESFYVISEALRNYKKIGLLFSGGKDSSVLLSLVMPMAKAMNVPISVIHIDTGLNFPEILGFRDELIQSYQESGHEIELLVGQVSQSLEIKDRNRQQSFVLNEMIEKHQFDVIFGGGRRDEDKARQKELFFSLRQATVKNEKVQAGWQPEQYRPEIWPWIALPKKHGEHYRVFPISNWTEVDIWQYIDLAQVPLCDLYFSHQRVVYFESNSKGINESHFLNGSADGKREFFISPVGLNNPISQIAEVRFRTIGDSSNTMPFFSKARTAREIFLETKNLRTRERGLRQDDRFSEFSMEIRKREGYF